jgi:predicted nucleotidyltransferase component of viral defense system
VLFTNTVAGETYGLLQELMALEVLEPFNLVGGTALSLLLGHRYSVDLDLFATVEFDRNAMHTALLAHFQSRIIITSSVKNTLGVFAVIDGVKVDICTRPYPLLKPIVVIDGVRCISLEDIAASKIFAISGRGAKKDFWDLDRLLDVFTIEEMAGFYHQRYQQVLAISVAKMVTTFSEAEASAAPKCLMKKTWSVVKKNIGKKINSQTK